MQCLRSSVWTLYTHKEVELLLKTGTFGDGGPFQNGINLVSLSRYQLCISSFLQSFLLLIVLLTPTCRTGCSDSFGKHIFTFNMLEYELEASDSVGSFSITSWKQIHLTDSLILFPHQDSYLNPQPFPVSLSNILSLLPKPINFL